MLDDRAGPCDRARPHRAPPRRPRSPSIARSPYGYHQPGVSRPRSASTNFDVRQRVEAVARPGPAEAGRAPAAPRRLRRAERVRMVVEPHRARSRAARRRRARASASRGPDARAEPERRVVGPAHHPLVVVQSRQRRPPGPKSSSARQARVARLAERAPSARGTSPAGRVVGRRPPAATCRPVLDRVGDERLEPGALALADERAEVDVGVESRARSAASRARVGEPVDERVVESRRHGDPLDPRARLAAVREGAPERALDGPVEVGVVEHEHRVLAAELEHDRAESLGRGPRDVPADLDRAREHDPRAMPRWRTSASPDVARALHDADEPGGRAGPAEQLLDPGAGERRQLRGLDDRGVPRGDRRRGLARAGSRAGSSTGVTIPTTPSGS